MCKAEKLSQNRYPTLAEKYAFIDGYEQAEKDNELTWEDVEIIINAFLDFYIENKERGKEKGYNDKEYCVEVLKRFKDLKK
jgi:hypothetical protein